MPPISWSLLRLIVEILHDLIIDLIYQKYKNSGSIIDTCHAGLNIKQYQFTCQQDIIKTTLLKEPISC